MSLYVYISRKPDPTSDEGPDITEEEWRAVAQKTDPSGLDWYAGQIEAKNADSSTIVRMHQFATSLSARVVSETGELFDAQGKHAGFEPWSEFSKPPSKRSLLSRIFGE